MRKTLLLLPVALLALSACGGAKNEAAEANETITGDSNTMGEAVSDVNAANAATDDAFTAAENSYEGNVADAGNEIEE
jgi:ABC-type glycerol-3-phosphate transport system substrate-binding protein